MRFYAIEVDHLTLLILVSVDRLLGPSPFESTLGLRHY